MLCSDLLYLIKNHFLFVVVFLFFCFFFLFCFSVSALCFQIFTVKLILWPNNWADMCNFFNSKLDFLGKTIRNYILLFFTDIKLLIFHNNIVKFSEILNKWNLIKTYIQTTYYIHFYIIYSHFTMGKWNFSFF